MTDENKPSIDPEAGKSSTDIKVDHVLITKIDVSKSIVDPILYMRREMLLYEPYKTSEDEDKVIDFFHASYGFRIAFSAGNDIRASFALYPAGNFLMSGAPSEDLSADHTDEVKEIYSILVNVTLDEWIGILDTDAYRAFKSAKDDVGPVLGWKIEDYRSVPIPPSLTKVDQVTYAVASDLWKKARAI